MLKPPAEHFSLIPKEEVTMVLPYEEKEAMGLLKAKTSQNYQQPYTREERSEMQFDALPFQGKVEDQHFLITIREGYVQYFSPLIYGSVEGSSRGSIIFYQLLLSPGTSFLLWMALFLTLAIGLLFLMLGFFYYFAAAIGGFALFFALVYINFRRELAQSKTIFESIFY